MNPQPDLPTDIALLLLPWLLCALVQLAHSAAVYLEDGALRQRAAQNDPSALRLQRMLEKNAALQSGVTLLSLCCLAVSLFAALRLSARLPWLPQTAVWLPYAVALVFVLLFYALGMVAPRRLAGYHPGAAYPLSLLLQLCRLIIWLPNLLCEQLIRLVVRLTGHNPDGAPHAVTEEEIRMLVDEGEERGAIEEQEKEMINNIFEFDDLDVSQVMTHRTEVEAVAVLSSLDQVTAVAMNSGYSRLPVYEEDIDSICGILNVKDLLQYLRRPEEFRLSDVMRRPQFVPESASCADVFALLQREKTQIAVVVDEYGGTYGIVTMEDLLESIVGNIQDEYDDEDEDAVQVSEGVYLLDGSMSIPDAERLLSLELPEDCDADTLGGFVTELLGGVPRGEGSPRSVAYGHVTFTVVRSDERRIVKLRAALADRDEQ